ncbi:MAG: imidazole glycerol phosphate synthase subunit HisH [Saprospiraceae bacterium]|jgi:glutamine amidotransferase|nr:imidazole glycerol phosphate synthase subunit HisH [Saprospiraceae bacterium]MBL0025368.1 imidazole glycerol phosphate synthase subunit HisH [Saprospiraceae bacterium]
MTVIVDYGAGNTRSVMNTLDRIGAKYTLSSDSGKIRDSERLILPGVGHAGAAMLQLNKRNLINVLQEYKNPFLGICLGMQLMYEHSEEGNTTCLGLIPGIIKKFKPDLAHKVPHMGWNDFYPVADNLLFSGLDSAISVYFVHSFYAENSEFSIGSCNYKILFCAAVGYNNFYGLQFHPEKSGSMGQCIIRNFLKMENNCNNESN